MIRILKTAAIALILALSANALAEQEMFSLAMSEFNLPEFDEFSVPVVLTATRLQQHQADVPASVTILDEHFIKQVGGQNLAELLRYVPGMMVGPDEKYNADSVHYHGGPAALPKNLQVLVNGRSMYRSGLAAVSWYEMPVAIEDIKRIEVVRGPNAASYGANAFQAIINILTKNPADTHGSSVSLQGGNNGEENIYVKQGGRLANSDYRVSFTQKSTDNFAGDLDSKISRFVDAEHYFQSASLGDFETSFVMSDTTRDLDSSIDTQVNDNQVNEKRVELGTAWTKDLSSKHQLKIKGYYIQSKQDHKIQVANVPVVILDNDLRALYTENNFLAAGEEAAANGFLYALHQAVAASDPNIVSNYYLGLTDEEKSKIGLGNIALAGNNTLTTDYLQAYGNEVAALSATEQGLINSMFTTYASTSPLAPVSGVVNADIDEYRYDIEIQDTFVYSPDLTLVSGASFRRDVVKSKMYFFDDMENDTTRLFASATWQATTHANLHLGGMFEKETNADLVFAPRAAMNYKLTPSQSIRLVYSEAVRSPDFMEQNANWQLIVENVSPSVPVTGTTYYKTQQGPGNLDHQYIRSYELGYYGRFNGLNGELDVRVFQEDLTDVFYQSITIDDFETINGIEMSFSGVEWQYSFEPWEDTHLRWVGAYVDASTNFDDMDNEDRVKVLLKVYAKNTHTFSWLQTWAEQTSSSLSLHVIDSYDEFNDDSDLRSKIYRLDAKLMHTIGMPDVNVALSINLQHDLLDDPYIWDESVYESQTRVQFAARVNF